MGSMVEGPSRVIDLAAEPAFRVGAAAIDPRTRMAQFDGTTERVQPQNLKVLIALAQRRGDLVTRNDLIELCWDGRFIGDDVINRAISVLRQFAERVGGFAIETVPRAGYRLTEAAPERRSVSAWGIGAAIVTLALVVLTAGAGSRLWPARKPIVQSNPSVPIVGLSGFTDPTEDPVSRRLALATRDALTRALTEGGMPIHLVGAGESPAAAPTDFLIAGDIRKVGNIERATISLEETRQHTIIYSRQFDAAPDQLVNLPDRIAASIAATISWTGAMMILDRRHPSDPATTAELMRQISLTIEGRGPLQAYQIAGQAVARAPDSAIAQLALAFNTGYVIGILPRDQRAAAVARGRIAADRALMLAPEFGDSYIPWCLLHSRFWLAECEQHLRYGLGRDPNAPFVSTFLTGLMDSVGREQEALAFAQMASANDPYTPSKLSRLVLMLEATGDLGEAANVYANAKRLWPGYGFLPWQRLLGKIKFGDERAVERFVASVGPSQLGLDAAVTSELFSAERFRDSISAARVCDAPNLTSTTQALCMLALARMGDLDHAFSLAQKLYPPLQGRSVADNERLWLDSPDAFPLGILTSPGAAVLRRDPRFLQVAERTGLTRYWRKTGKAPDFCTRAREPLCPALLNNRKF